MNAYERDLDAVASSGIEVFECKLIKAKGLSTKGWIAIDSTLSTNEKRCLLAEEYCHILYNIGDITDQKDTSNRKQELYAKRRSYEMLAPMKKIKQSCKKGNTHLHEIAEDLEIAESFLIEAIEYYKIKYGGIK